VNSATVGDTTNSNVAAIIDQTDVSAANDTLSVFKSIDLITGITAGVNTIVPGALLSSNFDVTYGLGTLTILPAPLTVRTDSSTITYGSKSPSFASNITGYQYQDNADSVFTGGVLSYNLLNSSGTTVQPTNVPSGKFNIVPSGTIIQPSNYNVQYVNGLLTINAAVLNAKAVDTFKTYGNNNPVFRITYTGFLNGDNPLNITPPVASTTATVASGAGTYPITLTGGSAANYNIVNTGGTLTIKPATLTVKADNKTICVFAGLPVFTSTITGFVNGDASTIISGPVYKVSPASCNQKIGTYIITPSGLKLSTPANYNIVYLTGTLYVTANPKNSSSRQDSMGIVTTGLTVAPMTLSDIAGVNQLTPGQQTLSYQNPNKGEMIAALTNELLNIDNSNTFAYPNPTNGRITLKVSNAVVSANGITITDVLGRAYSAKSATIYGNMVQLDLSGFESGVYFIKVMVNDTFKIFRIIKQ
jgi:hypothetical protein